MIHQTRPSGGPIAVRVVCGFVAGLFGAAAVELAGRAGEAGSMRPRPTLPALGVAEAVRMPAVSTRQRGPARRTTSFMLGMETAGGPDPSRVELVGAVAHYLWGGLWGVARVGLDSRSGAVSAALAHFLLFAATDHAMLATTGVGTPIWAPHPPRGDRDRNKERQGPTGDAVLQLAQLVVYVAATNHAYGTLRPPLPPRSRPPRRR